MARADATPSFGFEISYLDPTTETESEFPPVAELTLPEGAVEEVDVTDHKSTGQTFIPVGPPLAGELEGRLFWRDEDEELLRSLRGKKTTYTVTAPTGATWEFQGFLRSFASSASGINTAEERSFTIRVDGGSTYIAGS